MYNSGNWLWLATWPPLLKGYRRWVFPQKLFGHESYLPPLRWCHSGGPQAANSCLLGWSEEVTCLHAMCVGMSLPNWPLVGALLGCHSCVGLGAGSLLRHHNIVGGVVGGHSSGLSRLFLIGCFCLVSLFITFFSTFRHLSSSFPLWESGLSLWNAVKGASWPSHSSPCPHSAQEVWGRDPLTSLTAACMPWRSTRD